MQKSLAKGPANRRALLLLADTPRAQQFRRPHVVGGLKIPSGASCGLQAPWKPTAVPVVLPRGVPIAFFRLQSAGASQVYQRHGRQRGERKGVSTFALVVPLSAG